MAGLGGSAGHAADGPASPGGPCLVCSGTGGGIIPCTACNGTGRVTQAAPAWLSGWQHDGGTVEIADSLIAIGFGASDEHELLFAALDARDQAKCYVCEGSDIAVLRDRPLAHYDMTGGCRDQHPHVVWDIASSNLDEIGPAAQELILAVVDPSATWMPPGDTEPGNFAALINPGIWRTLPVVTVALWAAGSSGHGSRAAMEWLSSGHLAQMAALCQPVADRLGRGPLPLFAQIGELLAGPGGERQAAVKDAWQALAPVEEAIRLSHQAQPLDLRAWLGSSAILAVSLPAQASMAQRQVAVAMLVAAKCAAGYYKALPEPTVIWHHVDAPHARGDGGRIAGRRWLILAEGEAGFANWTHRAEAGGTWRQPPWALGSAAGAGAQEAAMRRLSTAGVPRVAGGQMLLIRDASPPLVLTPSAR